MEKRSFIGKSKNGLFKLFVILVIKDCGKALKKYFEPAFFNFSLIVFFKIL